MWILSKETAACLSDWIPTRSLTHSSDSKVQRSAVCKVLPKDTVKCKSSHPGLSIVSMHAYVNSGSRDYIKYRDGFWKLRLGLRKPEVVLLSGLARSLKENESPVRCGWTELTPGIECKQVLDAQFSFFQCCVWSWAKERERESGLKCARSKVRVRKMERERARFSVSMRLKWEREKENSEAVRCNKAIIEWRETQVWQVKLWDQGSRAKEAPELTLPLTRQLLKLSCVCTCACLLFCTRRTYLNNRRPRFGLHAEPWTC